MFEKAILFLMKKNLIISLMMLVNHNIFSQNLVPNPSFEDYTLCPDNTNQVSNTLEWMNFGNTPDYFNSCSTNLVSVPENAVGYQFAVSGQAYCGLHTYFSSPYREIIGVQLISPLQPSTKYYVSLKVNYSNSSIYYNCTATNKLGVKFTNTVYSEFSPPPIDNISHVYSDSIISDTLGWFQVFGSFTPSISYQYLMIGNFFDDNNTDTIMVCSMNVSSYYYIDDICVSTDSNYAYNYIYTGITEKSTKNKIILYPNPSNGNLTISSNEVIENYTIYSSLGQIILDKNSNSKIFRINLSSYSSGIYFIDLKTNQSILREKIIINP